MGTSTRKVPEPDDQTLRAQMSDIFSLREQVAQAELFASRDRLADTSSPPAASLADKANGPAGSLK